MDRDIKFDKTIKIVSKHYPLEMDMIFDNIGPQNCEDMIWQNIVDSVSLIESDEIGCCVTQSYQYTKLSNDPTILVRWQAIKTKNGPEFRIGLGTSAEPGNKNTPPIMSGNFTTGIDCTVPIRPGPVKTDDGRTTDKLLDNTLGLYKGELAVYKQGQWYPVVLGDSPIE